MDLLNLHFLAADVLAICKIHTSARQQEDFIAWQPDSKGCFNVRSAYKLAMEQHEESWWGLLVLTITVVEVFGT